MKMSKGTIIYIGGFELPDKNAAAHRVLGNGKILRNLGYNVVFIGVDKSLQFNNSVLDTRQEVQGFDSWYISYPKSKKEWFVYLSSIKSFIDIYNKYTDVKAVICYNYQSAAFLKIMRFCRSKGIKVLADCTEWYGAQGTGILMKTIKGIDSFIRMRILQRNVDGLIIISKYLYDYYKKHKNIILIPPLVDLVESKWVNQKIISKKNDCLKLVYSGSPGFKKDKINLIIRSLYTLRDSFDFHFTIIGINTEEYLNFYPSDRKIIEKLSNKVRFLGRIPHFHSLEELIQADFSIFFRENNIINKAGFPTKLVESISCGIPVITNETSNITDYIEPGYNGFIISDDIESDLKSIFLLNNTQLKEIKSNIIKGTFDYRNYVKDVHGFIEKTIQNH